VYFEDKVYSR